MSDLPPSPQTPKSRSGCLLAIYIVLGVGAVVVVIAGIGLWVFLRSERGQKLISVASEGMTLMREASNAPGTDALRAAGCSQAMVIQSSRVQKLMGEFPPAARQGLPESFADATFVMCQLATRSGEGPDCAEVARVYAGAAPQAPEPFGVIVQRPGGRQPQCQGSYARDGSLVGALERR